MLIPQSLVTRSHLGDAVARWLGARADGLTADQAAHAVGVSRSALYRWSVNAQPKSRRPNQVRKPAWTPALSKAAEDLRADNPMYGKRKLAALLRREGVRTSISTVGRILRKLMDRGVVIPVPDPAPQPRRSTDPAQHDRALRPPLAQRAQAQNALFVPANGLSALGPVIARSHGPYVSFKRTRRPRK